MTRRELMAVAEAERRRVSQMLPLRGITTLVRWSGSEPDTLVVRVRLTDARQLAEMTSVSLTDLEARRCTIGR